MKTEADYHWECLWKERGLYQQPQGDVTVCKCLKKLYPDQLQNS